MRKMFTRLIVVMILLVVSNAYQANASPPDIGNDYNYEVVTPDVDNFVINQVAPDVEVYMYSAPEPATEESFYVEIHVDVMVREVAYSRKISVSKTESYITINSAGTDNYENESPPLICESNVATNNYLVNLQHTNYSYPKSARTYFFS